MFELVAAYLQVKKGMKGTNKTNKILSYLKVLIFLLLKNVLDLLSHPSA